jgi:hypothetical protein
MTAEPGAARSEPAQRTGSASTADVRGCRVRCTARVAGKEAFGGVRGASRRARESAAEAWRDLGCGLLSRRLPGPLGFLARLLASGIEGERGFDFWWVAATLGLALVVGALLALVLTPVAR